MMGSNESDQSPPATEEKMLQDKAPVGTANVADQTVAASGRAGLTTSLSFDMSVGDTSNQMPAATEEKMLQDKALVGSVPADSLDKIGKGHATEASHASTAFSYASRGKITAKAKQDADEMVQAMEAQHTELTQPVVPEEQRQAAQLMHGEVEFTGYGPGGHRGYYLIVPPEMEEADEILRWMFVRKDGWRMKAPNLLLSSYGGRDHYINWAQSTTLKNKEAWEDQNVTSDHKFSKKFKSRLEEIAGGVCQAVTECGGWFDTGMGSRGGLNEVMMDGLKVHWSAFGSFAGHKEDNVVFAVRPLEETQFAEEFFACAKPCDKPGADTQPPQTESGTFLSQVMIVQRSLEKRVMYPSVNDALFPELSGDNIKPSDEQDLGDDEKSTVAAFGRAEFDKEVQFSKIKRFLMNAVTHIVFTQNVAVANRLRLKMKSLTTRAVIFANGNMNLISPGVDGKILLEAMAGVPVVCLHNTGGAAEQLGAAVLKRRMEGDKGTTEHYVWSANGIRTFLHVSDVKEMMPGDKVKANQELFLARQLGGLEKAVDDKLITKKDYDYNLPENIPDDQFLILNPAKDSVEKVINKLTLVLSTVQDTEMTEVGYAKAEENRLSYAWEKYALFLYNARIFRRRARLLYYISSSLALLITTLSLLRCASDKEEDPAGGMVCVAAVRPLYAFLAGSGFLSVEHQALFVKSMLVVMPLFSAFVITLISRMNHLNKWASLESGSIQIQSHIYQYRCRVLAYMPRKNSNMDIEERVEELCERHSEEALTLAKRRQQKQKQGKTTKELSRRMTFCTELERINSDAVGSDLRQDALAEPSNDILKEISERRYDSNTAKTRFRKKSGNTCLGYCRKIIMDAISWCCFCKKSKTPVAPKKHLSVPLLSSEVEEDNVWMRKGGDWTSNPSMIEDDFLRDDGIGLVTAEDYIHFRFLPMLQYYNFRSQQLSKNMQFLQIMIFLGTAVVAGAGALEYEHWVPLIVAFISFMNGILEFENFPSQLRNVNQCLESLTNLRLWWQSLSMVERRMPRNKHILVQGTEMTADAEISSWKKTLQPKVGAHMADEEDEDKKKSIDD